MNRCRMSKGNRVNIPEPGHGDRRPLRASMRGNANELGDVVMEPEAEFSFLLKERTSLETVQPEIGIVVPAKRRGSCGVSCAPSDP